MTDGQLVALIAAYIGKESLIADVTAEKRKQALEWAVRLAADVVKKSREVTE